MKARRRAALGFKVRTGRAVVVAIGGALDAPEVLAKTRIDVAFSFEEGAVFHVAQELPIQAARTLVSDAEARFTERARKDLGAFTERLGAKIVAAALVAAAAKPLPPLEVILKAHPLVHAAEGELYRRVFSQAAAALGQRPTRTAAEPSALSSVLRCTPENIAAHMAAMGKASGKPWAADQKQAALVAWLALASA
jgi:hypothetical protein